MDTNILFFPEIDSTNSYALEHLDQLMDGTMIVADSQTAGRGRFARKWVSDSGNVHMSIVLKPDSLNYKLISGIGLFVAVIISRVLEDYKVSSQIKWPNDILVGGKKIGGILVESSIQGSVLRGLVVGIGLNLQLPDTSLISQPVTALCQHIPIVNRDEVVRKVNSIFFKAYREFSVLGVPSIRDEYLRKMKVLSKVTIQIGTSTITGKIRGIDAQGNLEIERDSGTIVVINSGEIIDK